MMSQRDEQTGSKYTGYLASMGPYNIIVISYVLECITIGQVNRVRESS